jgi:hypothetical protein
MRILPQSAPFSYSLLPAPAPLLMLPAPQFAGLLPAPKPQITVEKISKRKSAPYQPSSRIFRSIAEWNAADAELANIIEGAIQRLNAIRDSSRPGVIHA